MSNSSFSHTLLLNSFSLRHAACLVRDPSRTGFPSLLGASSVFRFKMVHITCSAATKFFFKRNFNLFFKEFIYLFLERGEGKKKERQRNINAHTPSHTLPTGDLAGNTSMCPHWESNQRPFGSQACTQSTEPHQPGQKFSSFLSTGNLSPNSILSS